MKKLNNKGFAITGILYTLLVMFLLVLVFSLQILRANKKMREKSTEKLEGTYEGIKIENINNPNDEEYPIKEDGTIKYRGKYIFTLDVEEEEEKKIYTCTIYLEKGTNIFKEENKESSESEENTENKQKIQYKKFIPDDCNKYELTFDNSNNDNQSNDTPSDDDTFEEETVANTVANKIKLKEVYKFEGD